MGPMGPMGPLVIVRALKNDRRRRGSVHAKFQPVASHGDPFRDILGPMGAIGPIGPHRAQWALWYQVLGTKCQVLGTKYQVLGAKH